MSLRDKGTLLLVLGLCALSPAPVYAWGETGHRVICQIAYDELQPAAREELDRLIARDSDFENFAESCLFADTPERIRWQDHFVNLPRSAQAITTLDCPLAETCVLPAIRSDFLIVLDPDSTDDEKWLAIKLLGHWVGDVHQPLHVSFQDDRGANSNIVDSDIAQEFRYDELSLHGVWDYTIIANSLGDDFVKIAAELGGAITEQQKDAWQFDSPIEWANESYQVTIAPETGYCVQKQGACWYSSNNMMLDDNEPWHTLKIDNEYLRRHAPLVQKRLQQAGIRLAQILNQSLIRK
ncbi:MAG: S1/P1 nuclease [Woeseiaceae bacterium]